MTSIMLTGAGYHQISKMRQLVYIGGVLQRGVECLQVVQHAGLSGTRAQFAIPTATFETNVGLLEQGAEIVVYAWHDGVPTGAPLFRGYADRVDGDLRVGEDRKSFSARSPIGFLDKIQIGQNLLKATQLFRRLDRRTGQLANWTLRGIVNAAFAGALWPSDWNSKLSLGDTFAFDTGGTPQILATDTLFVCASYEEFLLHILALAGNVGVRERFTSSKTFLDFYTLGPYAYGALPFRVASLGESVGDGLVTVSELSISRDLAGIANRVLAYTAPRECVVTITTASALPLAPLWPNATPYGSGPLTAAEQGVLDDPDSAIEGTPTFVPGREKIFREYGLPADLRNFVLATSLPIVDSLGRRLPSHAFATEYDIIEGTGGGAAAWVTDGLADDPTILPFSEFDGERMTFTLAKPAVRFAGMAMSGNVAEVTFERMDVSLTCSLILPEKEGGFDTGVSSGITLEGLGTTGLTDTIHRPDLETVQYTSRGLGITEIDGTTAVVYDAIWYDGATWQNQTGSALTITDDRPTAARLAMNRLDARKRMRSGYEVTLEYHAPGLRIGDTIRVQNGTTWLDPVQVQAIVRRVSEDPTTSIVATDVAPEQNIQPSVANRGASRSEASESLAAGQRAGTVGTDPMGSKAIGRAARGAIADAAGSIAGRVGDVVDSARSGLSQWGADKRLARNAVEGPQPYKSPISTGANAKRIETIPTGGGKGEYAAAGDGGESYRDKSESDDRMRILGQIEKTAHQPVQGPAPFDPMAPLTAEQHFDKYATAAERLKKLKGGGG